MLDFQQADLQGIDPAVCGFICGFLLAVQQILHALLNCFGYIRFVHRCIAVDDGRAAADGMEAVITLEICLAFILEGVDSAAA